MAKVTYEIEIERSKDGDSIMGHYWWTVTPYVDGRYKSGLREYGWARSENKAKMKALKAVYKIDKEVVKGVIGVVFKFDGGFSDAEEALLR